MAAPLASHPIVNAGPGLPLDGQIAFASIDAEGAAGTLNSWVIKKLGLDPASALPTAEELGDGFAIRTTPGGFVVYVVTLAGTENSAALLETNLNKALRAVGEMDPENRRLWIPLMGTGAARLSAEQSLESTIAALIDSNILSAGQRFFVDLSFDPRMGREQVTALEETIAKTLLPHIDVRADDEPPPTSPVEAEPAPFHADLPATQDTLQRRGIADALVSIVRRVYADLPEYDGGGNQRRTIWNAARDIFTYARERWARGSAPRPADEPTAPALNVGRTFVVHIHGPWGSGKSSILNFMRQALTDTAAAADPTADAETKANGRWVVIDYNAWRQQDAGPPWWTLLTQVFAQAVGQLDVEHRLRLWASEGWWRFRSGWGPYVLLFAIVLWVVALLFSGGGNGGTFTDGLKVIATIFSLWAAVSAFGKSTRLGPASTANTFMELSKDPQLLLSNRYREVVRQIGLPVAVFIDDLDRCDGAFVVDLMQCLQTLYRDSPVIYVVAADRDWVRASYEKAYGDYTESIGEPGRPLGYLFLEKIFQLSVSVPQLSSTVQSAYWEALLERAGPVDDAASETVRREAYEQLKGAQSDADVRSEVEKQADPVRRQAFAAAAFQRLQDDDLMSRREHALKQYAGWLEPNPRSMKRLLNAYGFKVGYELLSGVATDPETLVRWTVVEMRWPTLAEDLALNPDHVDRFGSGAPALEESDELAPLYKSAQVREIVEPLTPDMIRNLTSGESGGMSAAASTV